MTHLTLKHREVIEYALKEKINNCNLKAFTSMYALVCFSITCLVIIGADYCKNTKCYKS